MTIGISIGGTYYTPDRNIQQSSKPNMYKVDFGDGYEQRLQRGINSIKETFNVSFNNRPNTEINTIMDFLDTKKGVTSISFTIPNGSGERTVKVVCDTYSQTYFNTSINSCTATFRRVYEP